MKMLSSIFVALAVFGTGTPFVSGQNGQAGPEVESYIAGVNDFLANQDDLVTPEDVPANSLPDDSITPVQSGPNDYPQSSGRFDSTPPAYEQTPSVYNSTPSVSKTDESRSMAPATPARGFAATSPSANLSAASSSAADYGTTYEDGDSRYFASQQASDAIWLLGINGLAFDRNFDGDRQFSIDGANPADQFFGSEADPGYVGGFEGTIARRNSRGYGWEGRYFGVFGDTTEVQQGGTPQTSITGLTQISDSGSGTPLATTFNNADVHSLTRDYDIHNAEFNMLQNGRCFSTPLRNRPATVEWLTGFRYFRFDESLDYVAISATDPVARSALNSSVINNLLGMQIGNRIELHSFNKVSFSLGTKVGLFNNRSESALVATNQDQVGAFSRPNINTGASTGTPFEFRDEQKDGLAVLGEVDLGLIYQFHRRARARVGYRAVGVNGVANADQNIPNDFTDPTVLGTANNDGDLILKGGYFGIEWSF